MHVRSSVSTARRSSDGEAIWQDMRGYTPASVLLHVRTRDAERRLFRCVISYIIYATIRYLISKFLSCSVQHYMFTFAFIRAKSRMLVNTQVVVEHLGTLPLLHVTEGRIRGNVRIAARLPLVQKHLQDGQP